MYTCSQTSGIIIYTQHIRPDLNFYIQVALFINPTDAVGERCFSSTLSRQGRRRSSSFFAKIRRDRRLSIPRHKSNGFIAHRKLSSSPAAAASYEAEDHVEDPRVRNANCNYGRACAHDILHPRSLFSLRLFHSLLLPFSHPLSPSFSHTHTYFPPLSLSLSFSFCPSFFFFLSASARESYGGTYERAFITRVYTHTRIHAYTLRFSRKYTCSHVRVVYTVISLTAEGRRMHSKTSKLIAYLLERFCPYR